MGTGGIIQLVVFRVQENVGDSVYFSTSFLIWEPGQHGRLDSALL
jgi:hypothetical protein